MGALSTGDAEARSASSTFKRAPGGDANASTTRAVEGKSFASERIAAGGASSAGAASEAVRKAKVTMRAMQQAEAVKQTAHAHRMSMDDDVDLSWGGYAEAAEDVADYAEALLELEASEKDDAATRQLSHDEGELEAMETPRRLSPTTRRAAADALARLDLGKVVVAPKRKILNSGGVSMSSVEELTAKPVDAAVAAAVLGLPSQREAKQGGVKAVKKQGVKKVVVKEVAKGKKEEASAEIKGNRVRAPTGSGAHKEEWKAFVDWKMMDHQDYDAIPDEKFEMLAKKLHIKRRWRPMVSYLVSLGLSTKELEKVLVNCEELFKRPVGKIMTRVEYLQGEVGIEAKDLRKLITKDPRILLQRNRHSIPRCRYLTEVGVPSEKLPRLLLKSPQVLRLSVEKGLKPRVAYFQNELHICEDEIGKLIERNPNVLTFSVENQIQPRVDFLKDMGISHEGITKMIVRHPHLLQYSFEGLEEHINFLGSIGMNEEDMVLTVTRLSQLFSLSVTNSLKPKFEYLTQELGGDVQTCVKFPAYFSLSLDQRIRPRHTYMQRNGGAPDPFPMKYLSENDKAFAARASRSLEEFEEYKEQMVPLFKQETAKRKENAEGRAIYEQQQLSRIQSRREQERLLMVKNQGYSQRIIDARNSMNRVRLGSSRMSR